MDTSFIKFPHTPHLVWLGHGSPRADKVMTPTEIDGLLQSEVVVEEKVDGANLGLSVGPGGAVRAQNRGNWLRRGGHPQFDGLWGWLDQRHANLAQALGDALILFGEWCAAVHYVHYGSLPDWFLGFDVYDRGAGRFWAVDRRDELCRRLGICVVPRLACGRFTMKELKGMLGQRSKVGGQSLEGIYVRAESNGGLTGRAKIVRPEFTQAIGEHWSKGVMRRNSLGPSRV